MGKLTKEEAIATVEAINTMRDMLDDYMMQSAYIAEAIDTLESAKIKIERIYREHD